MRALAVKNWEKLAKKKPKKKQATGDWAEKLAKMRVDHPNAYAPGKDLDDLRLVKKATEGKTVKEMSKDFGRHEGSIRSRLVKLLGEDWAKK